MLDYGWKRLFSGLLAVTLVAGMLPPVTVVAEETEATEVVTVLETEPVETEPAITEPVTTEPEATKPVETTVATEAVTEPVETTVATEETVPETTAETVTETTEATEPEETVAETTEETVAETTEETEATLPENVAAVQALIDALPDVDSVTAEDYDAVQDAYDAYEALTEEEKALIQGAEKFEALFAWFNEQAEALGTIASGKCGDKLTWVLDSSGTLSITGTGAMWAGSDENGNYTRPWNEFVDQITTVIIQDGVTSVGAFAFDGCANLDCVSLPATLNTLGRNCFSRCEKLTSVVIPKKIKEIPISAFWQCYNLASITLPEGITSLGNSAFAGCDITSITLPESLTTIDDSAFNGCTKLTEVTIPDKVKSLGEYAFSWCSALKTIHIPVSVTTIGEDAFYSCGSLTDIYYGGTKAQWNELVSSKIATENWPANATIHYSKLKTASGECGKNLTWVLGSEGTLTISGTGAMYDYTRNGSMISENSPFVNLDIRKLVFKEGITHIGDCAFISCTGDWGTVVLPESLQTIGNEAFHRCTALTGELVIPKNVWQIGGTGGYPASPFGGNRLESISVAEGNRYFTMEDGILYTSDLSRLIACPGKRTGNVTFPSNLKTIDGSAFYRCSGLTGGLTFPEGLQTIGMWAFVRCSGLNGEVSLPTTLETIDLSAFGSCSGLTGTLTLPSGVSVDRSAFNGCSSLTKVYIPGDVALLGDYLFDSGINIHTIHFDGTEEQWNNLMEKKGNKGYNGPVFGYVPSFNCYGQDFGWGVWEFNYRFWECMGGTLTIGCINGAEGSIPNYSTGNPAPWAQYQFQDLVIEGQVTRIGDYAFQGHTELTNVEFNNRVESIGTDAFAGCTGLQTVLYHGCKEELDVLPVESGNNYLLNANWTYHFLLITGAQNLGDGLLSGQSTQLTAIMKPDGTVQKANWVLPEEYQQYATLSSSGKITAKNVTEKVMITVWAEVDGYGRGGMSFYILPKATSLTIDQGSDLTVDMHQGKTMNLSVTAAPEGASNEVKWSTSDKKIATVNADGEVTLLKPGTVTITATATDGSKKTAKVTLTVTYLDTATKLTATAEVPTIGLQPGQTAPLTVRVQTCWMMPFWTWSVPIPM